MGQVLNLVKPQLYLFCRIILKIKRDAGLFIIAWELSLGSWEDWELSGACPPAGKQARERVRVRPAWLLGSAGLY